MVHSTDTEMLFSVAGSLTSTEKEKETYVLEALKPLALKKRSAEQKQRNQRDKDKDKEIRGSEVESDLRLWVSLF